MGSPAAVLLTSDAREAAPFRTRVSITFAVIAFLHVLAFALLLTGSLGAGAVTAGAAVFAYVRGLVHSMDFDHVSMIDNSTRKFVAEGRRPASVGLAFSAGHSTVVVLMGILVVAGAGAVGVLLNDESGTARTLGIIGLSVSGLYLILVGITNLATFVAAWKLRKALKQNPQLAVPADALTPRGLTARVMTAPLRRVRHPRHIYLLGFLFGLGFDTASTIGLLMVTGAAAVAGASAAALLALPLLFAAAMTLGDTINGLMMLKMYETANNNPAQKITYNLVVTGVSVVSALAVGVIATATLLTEVAGSTNGLLTSLSSVDTEYAGYGLAALFAVIGAVVLFRRRFGHRHQAHRNQL